ncbi:Interferon-inducible GTPase (IIGP) domain containing protein [Tylopilus felleus]
MGQLLTLSLRDYPQGEASTIANPYASRTAEACHEEATNQAPGFVAHLDYIRAHTSQTEPNLVAERVANDVERMKTRLDEPERSRQRGQGLIGAGREQGAQKAAEARVMFKRPLKQGSQPFITPSPEEFAAAKRRIRYEEGRFHFAVAGVAGSGKSSLVNAFRGLRSRDAGAAPVGITERALKVAQYPDPNPENPFVWYEIPGAGAIKRHDWQYFNDQGLFVFDAILLLFDNRFTLTDVAILANARRFDIPTYIVRSKADRWIRNIMLDMGGDSDDDSQDVARRNELYDAARKQLIEETRKSVHANLENANLPDQRVYIVSSHTLLSIVRNKMPKKMIDEVQLLHDLFNQVNTRRVTTLSDEIFTRVGSRG